MRQQLLAAVLALALGGAFASGCGGDEASEASGGGDPETLRVALLPDESANAVIQKNEPLKDYLEETLDKKVELVVTTDYSSMIEAMRRGRLELAYFGPLSYVLAKSKADIEPFAALEEKPDDTTYQAVVIANRDSGVSSPSDAGGKQVAFGDPASTSSHLIPRAMLSSEGLDAEEDYQPQFLGAHDAVALAVQNGNAEVGGLSKPIFESLVEQGTIDPDKVKLLATSRPYPNYPWTMQASLSPELKRRIRSAFLEMKDPKALEPLEAVGFGAVSDGDYDVVRKLPEQVGLSLEQLAQ
jgi:phosphonate transport system substrate-binding protein